MTEQSTHTTTVRTALVTGATRGIGRAIVQDLARDHIVFVGGRSAADVQRVRDELAGLGPGTRAFTADVSSDEEVAAAWEPLRDEFEGLNVLVHSAGIAPQARVEEGHAGAVGADLRRQRDLRGPADPVDPAPAARGRR